MILISLALLALFLGGICVVYRLIGKENPQNLVIGLAVSLVVGLVLVIIPIFGSSHDYQYISAQAIKVQYFEDWNERVPCRHDKKCRNSKGEEYTCGKKHMYDVDYHPPEYWITDKLNRRNRIDASGYSNLVRSWGNSKFIDLHRNYHTDDGDLYESYWLGKKENFVSVTDYESYENRVKHNDNVYKCNIEITPELIKKHRLYDYKDPVNLYQATLLDRYNKVSNDAKWRHHWNDAELGSKRRLKLWILIFNGGIQDAKMQECYWVNGRFNEAVICLKIDDTGSIEWIYPFGWFTGQLKADLVAMAGENFNEKTVDKIYNTVYTRFVSRNTDEINKSIPIQVGFGWPLAQLLFQIGILVGYRQFLRTL